MLHRLFKIKNKLLFTGDIVIFYLSIIATIILRYGIVFDETSISFLKGYVYYFTLVAPISFLIFYINNLYDIKRLINNPSFFLSIIKAITLNFLVLSAFFYFISSDITPKTILFLFSVVLFFLLFVWRYFFNSLLQSPKLTRNTILIGSNPQDTILAKEINDHPELGYDLKFQIDPKDCNRLNEILGNEKIQVVILGSDVYSFPDTIKLLYQKRHSEYEFINLNDFYEKIVQKVPLFSINEIWFLENIDSNKLLYDLVKQVMDIIASIFIIFVLLILIIPLSLAIKIESLGPVFYMQKRVGKNGKIFTLIKFRSMIANAEANGAQWTQKNDSRITKVGNFIRKTRLDELPQVINILKGEMSFIGPRPERPEFQETLKEKIPFYWERNLVKPGLTGWAQVKYQYASSVDDTLEKLQYDIYYVKKRSLSLDLAIILKTVNVVLGKRGR